jgi:hypothetical protein
MEAMLSKDLGEMESNSSCIVFLSLGSDILMTRAINFHSVRFSCIYLALAASFSRCIHSFSDTHTLTHTETCS